MRRLNGESTNFGSIALHIKTEMMVDDYTEKEIKKALDFLRY